MVVSSQLIRFSPRFQRAVHLRYDLRNRETIDRYIPTTSAVYALESILKGTSLQATQRAHLLYAAYGSGKSLFAVCVASLLENSLDLASNNQQLVEKIATTDGNTAQLAYEYLQSSQRLLPVVLSGNEGDFGTAIIRALVRTLNDVGLSHIQPSTRFDSALKVLFHWQEKYPHAISVFQELLKQEYQASLYDLQVALQSQQDEAFDLFESLYPQVTAGAIFDRFGDQAPELIYRDVVSQLPHHGYTGIVVIWDEFGRYLESRTTDAFHGEAASLQNFAETCNYSADNQIHLLLFTHKELQSYASNLPKIYQQEWSRIEGRFQRHNVTSDPHVAYRLIAHSIEHTDVDLLHELIPSEEALLLSSQVQSLQLFGLFEGQIVQQFIYDVYPLHPLTVYALVRLSNRVAQNERTMFTFLVADEPMSLQGILREVDFDFRDKFVRLDALWDYFEDAIRADTGVNGTHRIWGGVVNAIDKVPQQVDSRDMAIQLIKTIGVLLVCADQGMVRPTTNLLEWSIGSYEIEDILKGLGRRKAIINRKIDGYWTFTNGSDIDFEQKLAEVLVRTNPAPVQLRRLLERLMPPPTTLARRYNQERAMIRYFSGIYRWVDEVKETQWDLLIQQNGNPDGLVIYLLAYDDTTHQAIAEIFENHPRIVYVFSAKPLSYLVDILKEVFALQELENDPTLRQHEDTQRVKREIAWLIEDAQLRLEREISMLIDPLSGSTVWMRSNSQKGLDGGLVINSSYPTRLISKMCDEIFPYTPMLNSEGLNKHFPTTQQINASQKVIDALFMNELSETLGLIGYGPDVLNLKTLLISTNILRQENDVWIIAPPFEPRLANVWKYIDDFLLQSHQMGAVLVEDLVHNLTQPPYGLRLGVLPILFSSVLYRHLRVTTIRKDGRVQKPITGQLIIEMFNSPNVYTIEIGKWDTTLEKLWKAMLLRFGNQIHQSEYHQQPLSLLPNMMIRWLQNQPQFCRQTRHLDEVVLKFRDLIRTAQTEPGKVLFVELPKLLEIEEGTTQMEIENRLDSLMTAISNAYLELQHRLDTFARKEFGQFESDGFFAMKGWLATMQNGKANYLTDFRFGSLITQEFVVTLIRIDNADGQLWDKLAKAMTGVHLRDWTDQSETRFRDALLTARQSVEREVQELVAEESVVALSLQLPNHTEHEFRFRSADLSAQGKRLLQNFMSTLEIAGRPLSVDEKRQIAVAFLLHVMGEEVVGNRR